MLRKMKTEDVIAIYQDLKMALKMVKSETRNIHQFHDCLWCGLCRCRQRREKEQIGHKVRWRVNANETQTVNNEKLLVLFQHGIMIGCEQSGKKVLYYLVLQAGWQHRQIAHEAQQSIGDEALGQLWGQALCSLEHIFANHENSLLATWDGRRSASMGIGNI